MYLLLTWSMAEGPTPPAEIRDLMMERIAAITPQCVIIDDHTLICPSRDGDAEYERILLDLINISNAHDDQLRFALVKSKERLLDGVGFDVDLAKQIIK